MKPTTYILAIFTILLGACAEPAADRSEGGEKPVAIDTNVFQMIIEEQFANKPGLNGIILHVEAPDVGISWGGAIGLADKANKKALKAHYPALIASNTKTYVAAAIMRLIEEGKLNIDQPIAGLLTDKTDSLLKSDNYDLQVITLAHLMSHTSGIFDYCDAEYFIDMTVSDPSYNWSKEEQMTLSITGGDPIGDPGETFSYADMNYLILTEIIELQTGKPFYTAMRELLKYESLGLDATWFNILEEPPARMDPLVQQFATEMKVESYTFNGTFDLYGGGGIAATASDMAHFTQYLFEVDVFDDVKTLDLMHTEIKTNDSIPSNYYMGFDERETGRFITKGHGGFWGTTARYCPELNATVVVYVMERDLWKSCFDITEAVLEELDKGK